MKRFLSLLLMPLLLGTTYLAPSRQIDNLSAFANNLRLDMERLANEQLGDGSRPEGWTANTDIRSAQMISDLWFDNELLANEVFGEGVRPPEWFGVTGSRADFIARNVRHDLELAADTVYADPLGTGSFRPEAWLGAPSRFQCNRATQNVLRLAGDLYNIISDVLDETLNYCLAAYSEVEAELINELGLADDPRLPELTLAVRGDLERLADEKLGLRTRPPNWIGTVDPNALTLVGDNFLDLETLADELLGRGVRPDEWIGVVTNNPYVSWRNLRHDLELLADAALEARPRGWQRESELQRCEPEVQDLVTLVSQMEFDLATLDETATCAEISAAANLSADNPPIEDIELASADSRYRGESESAFTYLDVGATQYMGVMPLGIEFRAWYRNFQDSSMMFVSGDDFAVFIDRRWTTLPQNIFDNLPTLEGIEPLTFCDAGWCQGPGPTPTPTGSGPLALLLAEATRPAPPDQAEIANKIQVSWNNIRVTYITDNSETRTAQVALEICSEPAQVNCEPVVRIFDNAIGAQKAVLSQLNGLSVFEFPYGYTANLLIESATLTSPDVWISDPTIR